MPTWRGWLILAVLGLLAGWGVFHGLYGFLAVTDSRPGGALVVEGWIPDTSLDEVVAEYRRAGYDKLYLTGGPLDKGAILAQYQTFPELTAQVLRRKGVSTNDLVTVPAPEVRQDRTYAAACALRAWWREHHVQPTRVNLVSLGPHARRSRMLFEKALEQGPVGVIALAPPDYEPEQWWRTSAGVRSVTDEAIAYLYARILFRRPTGEAP